MLDLVGKFDEKLLQLLDVMAKDGVPNAARGISSMVGATVNVSDAHVRLVPFAEIPVLLGGPECEAVGIYLRVEGTISGQIMIVIPYAKALELVDMLMYLAPGTTQELGRMERSALAELGNMTGSFFLSAIDDATGLDARPSPPAVMVDMVGAILDVILAMSPGLSENVLMIEANFLGAGREAQASFWMIPDRHTLDTSTKRNLA